MPGFISTASTIAAGIRDDFDGTYQPSFDGVQADLADAMQMGVPFNHRTETFAMLGTMPYPERFDEGNEAIPEEGSSSLSFTVSVFDYGRRLSWKRKDREDNKVGDLRQRAMMLGQHFASLPSRIFTELMVGTASLLPAIPNAPDGAAPYSATDGAAAARFGVSGGNIETGGGVATSGAVQTDFYQAISRMSQFQDQKGQPYWDPNVTEESYTIYFNTALQEVFSLAFYGTAVHAQIAGTSTTNVTTGATVSNTILARGISVKLRPTSRITDNDWFVFRNTAPVKPFFQGVKRPVTMDEGNTSNSDMARTFAKEYVDFTTRQAYGVNVPFATVKVNN